MVKICGFYIGFFGYFVVQFMTRIIIIFIFIYFNRDF